MTRTAPAVSPAPQRIVDLPGPERPREKLLKRGPRSLGNAELLALVIGTGCGAGTGSGAGTGTGGGAGSALRIARRLLHRHGLSRLPALTVEQWRAARGIGAANACRLAAAFELARRVSADEQADPPRVGRPEEACRLVPELRRARKEHLVGLFLDAQNRLIAKETITIGSLNTTRTHPREIFHPAIEHLALGFVLVHNHPSGSLSPSVDDVEFTRGVRRAGELVGIELYDHVIVSRRGYVSLKERGLL